MRRRFTVKPSVTASKKVVKAATASTADMLDAFEDKLAEFGVESRTNVSCSTDDIDVKAVEIVDSDYTRKYEDVEGGFGEPGAVYTLAEIKEFWNRENSNDPVLKEYSSYDSWWKDTLNNFLKEAE